MPVRKPKPSSAEPTSVLESPHTGEPKDWPLCWFRRRNWLPFPFQLQTRDAYLAGQSGLIHASTGSGKTLAAWLGPVAEWCQEFPDSVGRKVKRKQAAPLRLLWITPLRALAGDTVLTLKGLADELALPWSVEGRTGDTASSIKSRQSGQLPTVLVTTPESLCLLLTREDAAERFAHLQAVVVDEWHELLSGKRGVQVELALARLRSWRPQLRTWGLSATLGNLAEALAVLVGPKPAQPPALIRGLVPKQTTIETVIPERIERFPWAGHLGLQLLPQVLETVESGRTALVFTNTRSQTEQWYQAILAERPDWAGVIALHHGSLDRKVREFVENGLKDGSIHCVVCTSSLDLGVDFTPVDQVVQVGSPKGVARLLQRAGRSGHQPGAESRVTCVPTNALELVEISAAREAATRNRIEGRQPLSKPLDVLVQHMITVAMGGGFRPDHLFEEVRQTHAYADLSETEWEWALDFAYRGGYSLRAYPEYQRLRIDPDGYFRVASPAIARRHRMAIGTIVGEALVKVQYQRGGVLGTVEESFIGKLKPGDHFRFAGKLLKLIRVHNMTAQVKKATSELGVVPRWMGSRMPLSSELAEAVRERLNLARQGRYPDREMTAVKPILDLQKDWSTLPATGELLVEAVETREGFHLFFYPFEGRLVHEGLAALTAYRLSLIQSATFSLAVNDYGFELLSPDPVELDPDWQEQLFSTEHLAEDALASMNAGEMARRAFREIARVAGLVFPGYPGQGKTAKQLQASSNLFYQVFAEHDPGNLLLAQAQREVLERQLEVSRLRQALERLSTARVVFTTPPHPTPLAFPLLVDRLRQTLSSEKLADRVRKMQWELEHAAGP